MGSVLNLHSICISYIHGLRINAGSTPTSYTAQRYKLIKENSHKISQNKSVRPGNTFRISWTVFGVRSSQFYGDIRDNISTRASASLDAVFKLTILNIFARVTFVRYAPLKYKKIYSRILRKIPIRNYPCACKVNIKLI